MWKTSAKGLVAGIASILIVMIILFSRVRNYSENEFFFFYWIIHHLIHFIAGTGLFFLFFRKNIFKDFPFTGSGYFVYWAGYFILYGLYDTVMYFGEYDIYILFGLPVLRIFLMVSFIFFMTYFFSKSWAVKILYFLIAPAASLISAAVSYFYYTNRFQTAAAFFVLTIILSISCLFYFHKISEKSGRRIYGGIADFT